MPALLLPVALVFAASAAAPDAETTWYDFTLANGLRVVLAHDPSLPTVTTNLTFDVGSGQDPADRAGLAHIYEHLVFQGSVHVPEHRFVVADRLGAVVNGSTGLDMTNYYFTAPPEHLPEMLYLLSEALGWLVPWLTEEVVQAELGVIQNERLQRYVTPPLGPVLPAVGEAGLPEGHPYARLGIGTEESINRTTLADVQTFFADWYHPGRATLVVYGAFDPGETRRLIRSYFGPVPGGPAEALPPIAPAAVAHSQQVLTRPVGDPLIALSWTIPDDPHTAAVASVLGLAVFSPYDGVPFHDVLVRQGWSTDASFFNWDRRGDSRLVLMTNVGRGRDPAAVSARIDQLFNELVLTEADLAAAVARQTLQLAMGERDPTTRAIGIQSALAAGLPPDHDYIAQLGQVTLADLEAMVAVLRRPRHEVLVLPQPEEAP